MRIETLSLQGLLAFPRRVTIDLRQLPPGLISVVGPNGAGKTTILESCYAGIYREFASRAKNLLDYVTGTNAFIEQTFALEGKGLYRTRIALDGEHRKADGTIAYVSADGMMEILNDGKVSTFDVEVRKLLPPKELLLASVLAAQNRKGSFAAIERKEQYELLGTLLGLDHYAEMCTRARTAASIVEQAIEKMSATRDVLLRDAGDAVEQELAARAQQLQAEGGAVEIRRRELAVTMAAHEALLDGLTAAAVAYAAAHAEHDRLTVDLQARQRDRAKALDAVNRFVAEATETRRQVEVRATTALYTLDHQIADHAEHTKELATLAAARDAVVKDADERIANNRKVLADEAAIRDAATQVDVFEAHIRRLRKDTGRLRTHASTLHARIREHERDLDAITRAHADYERAVQDADLLTKAPFGDDCAPCAFMTNAAAAKAQIEPLRQTVARHAEVARALAEVRAELVTVEREIAGRDADTTAMERQQAEYRKLAHRLQDLTAATERIASHLERKRAADAHLADGLARANTREQERVAALARQREARRADLTQDLAAHDARTVERQTALVAEAQALDALVVTDLPRQLAAAAERMAHTKAEAERASETQALLAVARREWDETTGTLARVRAQTEELARRVAIVRRRRMELDAIEGRLAWARGELEHWTVLQKALGRDGLPIIEIDNAGPTLSAFTNQLLEASGFGFLSIDLVTQQAKRTTGKDGSTMKEALDVKIFDARRGGALRDLKDLSGGEQVMVDEALKSAIALLVNEKNVFPIRTCWRDETTGALDSANAMGYMAMLRKQHELGGFHHTFFVTHNYDAALLADAQLVVQNGTVTTRLPPYPPALFVPRTEAA